MIKSSIWKNFHSAPKVTAQFFPMTVESHGTLLSGLIPTYSVFLGVEFSTGIFEQTGANTWWFNKLPSTVAKRERERKRKMFHRNVTTL